MKIELKLIKIKDIAEGYVDYDEDGVFAYNGKLSIRPPYQREFVYDDNRQKAVIDTVLNGFPLNIMYWVKVSDDKYEVLDGQQRTLSVMHYLSHQFSINHNGHQTYVDTLTNDEYDKLMNYEFMIYICEGTESEKLNWFRIVNVGGVVLKPQELRNSVYIGSWLTDAKKIFSKRNCVAKRKSDKYITGEVNRQDLLEKALKGICGYKNIEGQNAIEEYMSKHRNDNDANELWQYFQDVIDWVEKIFPNYYSDMKSVEWFELYNKYHNKTYNTKIISEEVEKLHKDVEVGKGAKIYEYVLCKDQDPFAERLLNLRQFDERQKRIAYENQKGICPLCKKHFEIEEMEGDHIVPWSKGGETVQENCQMLCIDCNRHKSNK